MWKSVKTFEVERVFFLRVLYVASLGERGLFAFDSSNLPRGEKIIKKEFEFQCEIKSRSLASEILYPSTAPRNAGFELD